MVKATKSSASPRHEGESVQDNFLQSVVKTRAKLTIFLVNGVKLSGQITQYDTHTIILMRDDQSQLVYKHAVSTILPGAPLPIFSQDDDIDDI
ncbi:RNA chaperone Hfq [Candidatus Kirkpatrickella diaphorinae]|uniref:RNA-binding protein Hfq n=1 Tax=Candidatus Kirkpatrickella diaphorinae TaxID=2984322 RepID=A0ABY6GKB9_9PROT|nr:RNA chaperone Hfq [Candidatus Kirkpatrickella diaphorinae]UYH51265.1 RNA chaperone Hfq [Candidatus Kirkpatrickella diaphorinae]